jgi:hypothetical protein
MQEDKSDDFCGHWNEYVVAPAAAAGLPIPTLVQGNGKDLDRKPTQDR